MDCVQVNGIPVFHGPQDRDTALQIGTFATAAVQFLTAHLGPPPKEVRVYVMDSFIRFRFHAAPWPYRPLFLLLLPFWYRRVMKLWPRVGGLTERYESRPAVGIKPPRLLQVADAEIRRCIMFPEPDMPTRLQGMVCHELTHAFTIRLSLPVWLNEGIAVRAAEQFLGKPMVRPDSLELLKTRGKGSRPRTYRHLSHLDSDEMAYEYARGYWITRFLDERHPELLRDFLRERKAEDEIESAIRRHASIRHRRFWNDIDAVVAENCRPRGKEHGITQAG